jgi:hypothetical protein
MSSVIEDDEGSMMGVCLCQTDRLCVKNIILKLVLLLILLCEYFEN